MKGVILAAGMAKRLRPLTDTKPKCLLEVGGKTLLQRTVEAMAMADITEFVVVTGYRADQIRDFLTVHFPQFTFHFLHNADYEHNNNIYSLWMAMSEVRGQDFLLMDSDILCDPKAVVEVAQQSVSALAMNRHELGEEEMKIVVDADHRITEISKTCRPEDAIGESVGIEKSTADYREALAAELEKERAANDACRKQIDDLKDQVSTLELKGAFMSGGDSSSASREKIDKLIREIDKCISLLEKD